MRRAVKVPFDQNHVLIAWGGKLANGAEQWACGLRMRQTGIATFPTHDQLNTWLNDGWKTALAAYWSALADKTSQPTSLTWMKANAIGTDGKYLDAATNSYAWSTPLNGSTGGVPTEVCLAVTTRTNVGRGHAHAGRWYNPTPTINLTADGTYSEDPVLAVATASAAYIHALQEASADLGVNHLEAAVMSRLGSGTSHQITKVSVGRVPDVQRSRRRSLKETPKYHDV